MLTSLMFSSSRNLSATDTFSSFCDRNVGRLLCLGNRLPLSTSMRAINRSPSPKSVSRLPMALPAVFRCSLAHRVNVFCWMSFQRASSAKSRSAAPMSSSWLPASYPSGSSVAVAAATATAATADIPVSRVCACACASVSVYGVRVFARACACVQIDYEISAHETKNNNNIYVSVYNNIILCYYYYV